MNVQHHEWGGAMHRGVLEQVRNLIDEKIADPTRIAVFGGRLAAIASEALQ
jgi:dipeptidyl aminopeptidase/acylaminoacyl peptidase